jgi:ABC-2 type transport system permease protein
MLFMGMLFLASGTAADIWKERTGGTLRRIASSPMPMSSYLVARVAFVAMLYVVVSSVGLLAAQRLSGLDVANLPAAALWMTFSGTVFYVLFLWIAVLPSTQRAASVMANLIIFPLAMLGGCFFPFEWMPNWMVTAGKLTPNGWALTQFKAVLEGAADPAHLLIASAALTGLCAVVFRFTLRRLRGAIAV